MQVEELATKAIHAAFQIHRGLGPGLLESVYERILASKLKQLGLKVRVQEPIDFQFDGLQFKNGFRVDLLINDQLIIEVKSVEALLPVHSKQVFTYLKLMGLPLGLLINFSGASFKDGCKRILHGYSPTHESVAHWRGDRG